MTDWVTPLPGEPPLLLALKPMTIPPQRKKPPTRDYKAARAQASRARAVAAKAAKAERELIHRRNRLKALRNAMLDRPNQQECADFRRAMLLDPCSYCGSTPTAVFVLERLMTYDHIKPVSKGGSSEWDNITPACRKCNCDRHSAPTLIYMLFRRRTADPRTLRQRTSEFDRQRPACQGPNAEAATMPLPKPESR